MKITVTRFEVYPKEEPSGYAVGFTVKTDNNRTFYRDIVIPFDVPEQRTDEEIVQTAFELLQEEIEQEVARITSLSPLVGTTLNLEQEEIGGEVFGEEG